MTHSNNSPQAQEVKLLPCPFCGGDKINLYEHIGDCYHFFCQSCTVHTGTRFGIREAAKFWNTRIPDSGSSPSAEECLEWLNNTAYDLVKQLRSDDWGVVTMEGYVVRGVGKSPLEAIRSAMSQQ